MADVPAPASTVDKVRVRGDSSQPVSTEASFDTDSGEAAATASSHAVDDEPSPGGHPRHNVFSFAMSLIALGIVFGDSGTSPLYAFNEVFNHHGVLTSRIPILGALSLIFWGLALPITVKYVGLALRIETDGEGGVFALYKIVRELGRKSNGLTALGTLLIFGAGLLYADGVITPAISVASAVEGLGAGKSTFFNWSE